MKNAVIGLFLAATAILPGQAIAAPRFAAGPGYSSFPVYSRAGNPSAWMSGIQSFDYDDQGLLYVMVENRYLVKDPEWSAQTLYDLGEELWTFPSFVKVRGERVYFGESYNHQRIFSVSTGGVPGPSAPLSGNYDCSVNSQSQVFISANWATGTADFSGNKIFYWDEQTLPSIVAVVGGNSGPIAFDRADNLYYGRSSQYPPGPEDVVYYTAAQVANALATGIPLTASDWSVFASGVDSPGDFVFDEETTQSLFSTSGLQTVSRVSAASESERLAICGWPTFAHFSSAETGFRPFLAGGGRLSVLCTDYPPLPAGAAAGGGPRTPEFFLALSRAGEDLGDADYSSAVFAVEPCPQNFILASGDYRGDGTSSISVFRPGSGRWAVKNLTRCFYGAEGDLPVSGDYAGNGTALPAIFRPSSGLWAVRGKSRFYFGKEGDIPLPRDYIGDGATVAAVFSPGAGLWAEWNITRFYFGEEGDFPLPEDYRGDGTADPAIFRPANGLWSVRGITRFYFGGSGDLPVPGDYDGVPGWEAAIYRPETGFWSVRNVTAFYHGGAGDWPVPADYDGNGSTDAAVFRPSNGLWMVRELTRIYFGSSLDFPASR